MKALFDRSAASISKLITRTYSTSFSLGIALFNKQIRSEIYAIYAFVRYADEIVDSFYDYDRATLLTEFIESYEKAVTRQISLNPVIHNFVPLVVKYDLDELVQAFFNSMKMDLSKQTYTEQEYKQYIYGSADVVGLMCLKSFLRGDTKQYEHLEPYAIRLGSAFQKVNFLRDFGQDNLNLGRVYFPGVDLTDFSVQQKQDILTDIYADFKEAHKGIKQLPKGARLGVYLAYRYYLLLLNKIENASLVNMMHQRIRVSNSKKIWILAKSYGRFKLNMI